jgi:hypothetical protein
MEGRINPVIEGVLKHSGERLELLRNAHKVRIIAIFDWNKPVKDELFDAARMLCTEYKFGFNIRAFDATFNEDREEVTQLPAFHIYYDFEYERTNYIGENLKESILEVIEKYKAKKWGFSWPNIRMFSINRRVVPVLGSLNTGTY